MCGAVCGGGPDLYGDAVGGRVLFLQFPEEGALLRGRRGVGRHCLHPAVPVGQVGNCDGRPELDNLAGGVWCGQRADHRPPVAFAREHRPAAPEAFVPVDGERTEDSARDGVADVYGGAGRGERGLPGLSEGIWVCLLGRHSGGAGPGVCVVHAEVLQAAYK